MKIFVYFVGKPKDLRANELSHDFLARISHYSSAQMSEIRPERIDLSTKHPAAQRVYLDPAGRSMDSPAFAKFLAAAEMSGRDLVFLVGGASGLPAGWREQADALLSLSPMTFPHELARVMLLEQIYRGFATLRGHPYPR